MNINWKIKSILFKAIEFYKFYDLLYFIQKYLTKRSIINIHVIDDNWVAHKKNLENIKDPLLVEFGAGKGLAQNIYFSQFCKSQVLVDLYPMIDLELFNQSAKQISELTEVPYKYSEGLSDIYRNYGIEYLAPFDLCQSKFKDNRFDACLSTNTLEHIPKKDIIKIFTELKRIVRNNGLISSVIDYSDHYAHTDKKISAVNFLQYSEKEYGKYNHAVHYQNRLRHYDYENIFLDLGFKIIISKASGFVDLPDNLSDEFDVGNKSIAATKGMFLLQVIKD